jgi:hypothetical protein
MSGGVIDFLPIILLSALFIIFLWRRHSLGKPDWVTSGAIVLGLLLLVNVIMLILNQRSESSAVIQGLLIAMPIIIFVIFLLFLLRIFTVEKLKSRFCIDERLTAINAKSARNALAAVCLNLVIDLLIYSNINTGLLIGILVSSLIVYLASMIIYYYRSF